MHSENYERGRILQVLSDNEGISTAVGAALLMRALDNLGVSLSMRDLAQRLDYLAAKGYVQLTRRKDLPGFERARLKRGAGRPDDFICAKLTPQGLDLVQGNLGADLGVSFEVS